MTMVVPTWKARSVDAGRLMSVKSTAATPQPSAQTPVQNTGWRSTAARSSSVGGRPSRSHAVFLSNVRLPHTLPTTPESSM
jgi:hypothetical protein